MKVCPECRRENPDEANFCHQCGTSLSPSTPAGISVAEAADAEQPTVRATVQGDEALWRDFIGPNADHYLAVFNKFSAEGQPRFALSWNWPAFLFVSFLWFLYRKMYLHALVYAVGPMLSTYLTGDFTVGIVWSIMAGATANYLYYWHCREQIAEIKKRAGFNVAGQEAAIREAGGVQTYVIGVGVVLYIIFFATLAKMVEEGPPDRLPVKPAKPATMTSL